jgi:hypothetical protein
MRRLTFTLIAGAALILSLAPPARAACEDGFCRLAPQEQERIRAAAPAQRIGSFVRENRLPSFNKNGKLFFATSSGTNFTNGGSSYLGQLSPNLVEFMISPRFHHLYTRIGDKTYSRVIELSESGYYTSPSERIGVLVQLTNSEMGRLKQYVDTACRNPSQAIGPFVYGGGRPPQASNCTSWVTWAPIGDRGETLARLLGVYESGFPQGFLGSLMRSSSDRVKAVVVHNPTREFNANYQFDLQ